LADLTGLVAFLGAAAAGLVTFCFRAGVAFFFATGDLPAGFLEAGLCDAAFLAGFLRDVFLVERAINLMLGLLDACLSSG
jgi:hypothetical protein